MAKQNYNITYSITPSLNFSSRTAAERHVEKEGGIWAGFLEEVAKSNRSFNAYNRQITVSQQAMPSRAYAGPSMTLGSSQD
ncbi:hypothetical protein [Mameliella alba]|uniref:hypothetical protein n=1 Tax=Mameliella alba TaxID=561184 RepID=UPI001ADBACF8|nr:hypothetical protein [Mameliella alba]